MSARAPTVSFIHGEPGQYWVTLDGVVIGEVWKSRHRTDRYPYADPSSRGRGRTRWHVSRVNDEDYGTRREAMAELVRRHHLATHTEVEYEEPGRLIWGDELRSTVPPRFSVQRSSVRGEGVCYELWMGPADLAVCRELALETAFYGSRGYRQCQQTAQRIIDHIINARRTP